MNERPVSPTPDSNLAQFRAADPASNVFVSANAGSGKTFVLTRRVLRVLLNNVQPENVLCLTYTKAAAAEMQRRVSAELGKWALMSDADLEKALSELLNATPSVEKVQLARTLFAKALETPGGLKIKTIHAFCESVLHRFPLEADIPMRFSVIEEDERQQLLMAAKNEVLANGLRGDADVSHAAETLFHHFSDFQIDKALNMALGARDLSRLLHRQEEARDNLKELLNVDETTDLDNWEQELIGQSLLSPDIANEILSITPARETYSTAGFAEKLAELDWQNIGVDDLLSLFLTGTQDKRKSLAKKAVEQQAPHLHELLFDEQDRLFELVQKKKRVLCFDVSNALLTMVDAVNRLYVSRKRARARLDFDDLIESLLTLLRDKDQRDWVRYKLDAQITHILVDESQDTNPDQWQTVDKLIEEFFEGEGSIQTPRSVFAVGDEKQSIYSFQGADATLFSLMRDRVNDRARQSKKTFLSQKLKTSFRTLDTILEAVDRVAAQPEISAALLADADGVAHESARVHKLGRVALWPLIVSEKADKTGLEDWPLETVANVQAADSQLADRIVNQIKHWLDSNRQFDHRGRAVQASDIMILVQRRGQLYRDLIRKLKEHGIPTPGADKLPVTTHIVVDDLLALTQYLQTPSDQLALAAVLRSPLFGISEQQLAELAIGRHNSSLASQLEHAGKTQEWAANAHAYLDQLRSRLDFERPYEFFAKILFTDGGLENFRARLGREFDDVVDTFLDLALAHEQADQPSLMGFVRELRQRDLSITRDLAEGAGVRVMTVHGAKGLEAPIVILADAGFENPDTSNLFIEANSEGQSNQGAHFVYAPNKNYLPPEVDENFRTPAKEKVRAEYWRKLYVAMTRAEDELYITGTSNSQNSSTQKWYQAVELALQDQLLPRPLWGEDGVDELFFSQVPQDHQGDTQDQVTDQTVVASPTTLFAPVPEPSQPRLISPSSVSREQLDASESPDLGAPGAGRIVSDIDPVSRGLALHALLQYLVDVPKALQRDVALSALENLLPDASAQTVADLAAKGINILHGEDAQFLFGAGSRAEVPFVASGRVKGDSVRINGRIDRMIVRDGTVSLIDFKSDKVPPETAQGIGQAYVTQVAIYALLARRLFSDHQIEAGIYWTETESLMMIPTEALERATKDYELD